MARPRPRDLAPDTFGTNLRYYRERTAPMARRQDDLIPFPEGWARKQPVRSWLRKIFRVRDTQCVICGTGITLLRGTTAWEQHICSTCARTAR